MAARSVSASHPPVLPEMVNAESWGKTAAILRFTGKSFPRVEDVARASAALIWQTFPGASQRAVCRRAAAETGAASPDTFDRILSGETKRPDFYLMQCVQIIAATRGVAIPPALAVRIGAA